MEKTIPTYNFSGQSWSDIVNHMAYNRTVEAIVRNITPNNDNFTSDLSQDIYLSLLDKPRTKQQQLKSIFIKGDINFYVTRIVLTQIKSKNSETWRKYRKQTAPNFLTQGDYPETSAYLFEELLETVTDDNVIDRFPGTVKDMILSALTATTSDWYNINLCHRHLIEGQTLSSISNQTKIPLSSVFKTINNQRHKMKEWIQTYIENEL